MLTFLLVRTSLRKVTGLWVVDGHIALSVEVIGPVIAEASGEHTGLDLPIVRTIVEARRGIVTFTNTSGFDTKFRVRCARRLGCVDGGRRRRSESGAPIVPGWSRTTSS